MTKNELYARILPFLPGATIEKDNLGQLVIYTNMGEDSEGELIEGLFGEDLEEDSEEDPPSEKPYDPYCWNKPSK